MKARHQLRPSILQTFTQTYIQHSNTWQMRNQSHFKVWEFLITCLFIIFLQLCVYLRETTGGLRPALSVWTRSTALPTVITHTHTHKPHNVNETQTKIYSHEAFCDFGHFVEFWGPGCKAFCHLTGPRSFLFRSNKFLPTPHTHFRPLAGPSGWAAAPKQLILIHTAALTRAGLALQGFLCFSSWETKNVFELSALKYGGEEIGQRENKSGKSVMPGETWARQHEVSVMMFLHLRSCLGGQMTHSKTKKYLNKLSSSRT